MFGSNDAFSLKTSVSLNDKLSEHIFYVKRVSHRHILSCKTQTDTAGYKVYPLCTDSLLFYKTFCLHPG